MTKPIEKYKLMRLIDRFSYEFVQSAGDVSDWKPWLSYLVESIEEGLSTADVGEDNINSMLVGFRDLLAERIDSGGW